MILRIFQNILFFTSTLNFASHLLIAQQSSSKEIEDRLVENIWLDLHGSDVEYHSLALSTEIYPDRGTLSIEDWITLGRAIPDLETKLSSVIARMETEPALPISIRHIRLDKSVMAIGILGVAKDRSRLIMSLDSGLRNGGRQCSGLFPKNALVALGLIADKTAVEYLKKVATNRNINQQYSKTATMALAGDFLEKFSALMNLEPEEKASRLQRLKAESE